MELLINAGNFGTREHIDSLMLKLTVLLLKMTRITRGITCRNVLNKNLDNLRSSTRFFDFISLFLFVRDAQILINTIACKRYGSSLF